MFALYTSIRARLIGHREKILTDLRVERVGALDLKQKGCDGSHRFGHGHDTEESIALDGELCLSVLPANGLSVGFLAMSVNEGTDPLTLPLEDRVYLF